MRELRADCAAVLPSPKRIQFSSPQFDRTGGAIAVRRAEHWAITLGGSSVFGSHGSLSVNDQKGTFYDHEAKEGGGLLDFIERKTGRKGGEAQRLAGRKWLAAR